MWLGPCVSAVRTPSTQCRLFATAGCMIPTSVLFHATGVLPRPHLTLVLSCNHRGRSLKSFYPIGVDTYDCAAGLRAIIWLVRLSAGTRRTNKHVVQRPRACTAAAGPCPTPSLREIAPAFASAATFTSCDPTGPGPTEMAASICTAGAPCRNAQISRSTSSVRPPSICASTTRPLTSTTGHECSGGVLGLACVGAGAFA